MFNFKKLYPRPFRKYPETHVILHDNDEAEFPESYVARNKRELECIRQSLVDEEKNIRHHRLFSGALKWTFYLLVFYLFSDVLLELLYRFHLLVHSHAPWDIPMLIKDYFFEGKRGFPGYPS